MDLPRLRRATDLEVNDVPDGVMLYRAADDSVHHLNPSATIVFELCEGRTRDDLVPPVADLLDVSPAEAATVVDEALAVLTALALVRPITPLVHTGP